MNRHLEKLKRYDCEILSYISDKLYERHNFNTIKTYLDNNFGTRFTSKNVTLEENLWLINTFYDAENIIFYQNNVYNNVDNVYNNVDNIYKNDLK